MWPRWWPEGVASARSITGARSHALSRSFFHFCVVLPLDKGNHLLASELIDQAEGDRLITGGDATRMRAFRSARLTNCVSSRMSALAEQFAKDTWMREFISASASTFCTVTPEAPRAESGAS